MPRLSATLEVLDIDTKNWLEREHRTTFVRYRSSLCSHTDALTIEIPIFLCESCFGAKVDGILVTYRGPDVLPESWESDLANLLDDDIESIAQECYSPRCQSCRRDLRGEAWYVETVALAERLGISDETHATKPSKKLRNEVEKLYGRRCFGCGSDEGRLEADHIEPRSNGGKADFENLQPLCRKCNNAKRHRLPRRIVIVRDPWSDRN
jgi:5-methylcytosine-specific restriction endonuclease McrA